MFVEVIVAVRESKSAVRNAEFHWSRSLRCNCFDLYVCR